MHQLKSMVSVQYLQIFIKQLFPITFLKLFLLIFLLFKMWNTLTLHDFQQPIKRLPSSCKHNPILTNLVLQMLKLFSSVVRKIVSNVNTLNSLKHLNAQNVRISLIFQLIVSHVPMVTTLRQ